MAARGLSDSFVRQLVVLVAAAVAVHVHSMRMAGRRHHRQRRYFRDPARITANRTWKQMYAWRTNDQKWQMNVGMTYTTFLYVL